MTGRALEASLGLKQRYSLRRTIMLTLDRALVRSLMIVMVLLLVNVVNIGIIYRHFGARDGRRGQHSTFTRTIVSDS
jgi:hypothetical protein